MPQIKTSKCIFCPECNGFGCRGQLPGMGGVENNEIFILNYKRWKEIEKMCNKSKLVAGKTIHLQNTDMLSPLTIRLAPMTGAVENLGYPQERSWYFDIISACLEANVPLSIGDGTPDEKLLYGIEALKHYNTKAFVCIKPYKNSEIEKRFEWAEEVAQMVGIDIDAYEIITMRGLSQLERKTAQQLKQLKKRIQTPFALKGIFSADDIALVKEVKPDIAIISNHGGRVPATLSSTADFLIQHGQELAKYTNELWVDGGLRHRQDIVLATALGAKTVLIGRPFATALMKSGKKAVCAMVKKMCGY